MLPLLTLILLLVIYIAIRIIRIVLRLLKPIADDTMRIDDENMKFALETRRPVLTYFLLTISTVLMLAGIFWGAKTAVVKLHEAWINDIPSVETPYTEKEEAKFQRKAERYRKIDRWTGCAGWQARAYNLKMRMVYEGFGSGVMRFIYEKTNTNARLRDWERMQTLRLQILKEKEAARAERKAERAEHRKEANKDRAAEDSGTENGHENK